MFYKNILSKEDTRFVFEASLANSLRLKLFSLAEYDRLLDNDVDGVFSALSEKNYDTSSKDSDLILSAERKKLLKTILNLAKEEDLKKYFLLPLDFFNLKILYKGWLKDEKFENFKFFPFGTLNEMKLRKIYMEEGSGYLDPFLLRSVKAFDRDISERSPFEVDVLWDKYLHQFYLEQSQALKNDFLIKLHSLKIDLANISNLFRLKSFDKDYKAYQKVFIEGGQITLYTLSDLYKEDFDIIIGKLSYLNYSEALKLGLEEYKKTNSLSDMEKALEDFFLKYLKQASNKIFNYEVIIAYYWLKENELNNLRLLLTAKANSISKDWVLKRLRV